MSSVPMLRMRKGMTNTAEENVAFNHPHIPKEVMMASKMPTTPQKPIGNQMGEGENDSPRVTFDRIRLIRKRAKEM